MFQLNREEIDALRFHIGMSKRKAGVVDAIFRMLSPSKA
jgi:hypothetical protein